MDIVRLLTQHAVDKELLNKLRLLIGETLGLWSSRGPPTEQHLMFHHLWHFPNQLERWGPYRSTWMFPYERYFAHLNQRIRQRRCIEAHVMQIWKTCFLGAPVDVGEVLAGEARWESEFVFPYHKPSEELPMDRQQVQNGLVRCEPYQSIFARYTIYRNRKRRAKSTIDSFVEWMRTQPDVDEELIAQYEDPPSRALHYDYPVKYKGHSYSTFLWDRSKVTRGSYFRAWGPYLEDNTQTKYKEDWVYGRIFCWLRFSLQSGEEMLWAKVTVWPMLDYHPITDEPRVDMSAKKAYQHAKYIPIKSIYSPVLFCPAITTHRPPLTETQRGVEASEDAMLKRMATNLNIEPNSITYALIADNKMHWVEQEEVGSLAENV